VALGVSRAEGTGGLALLAAIFVSNFPEALVGSASMQAQGRGLGARRTDGNRPRPWLADISAGRLIGGS
jgi:hypothetical protein